MQIKRLELGLIRDFEGKAVWKDFECSAGFFNCRCFNISFWTFYVTWLSDECHHPCKDLECCPAEKPKCTYGCAGDCDDVWLCGCDCHFEGIGR